MKPSHSKKLYNAIVLAIGTSPLLLASIPTFALDYSSVGTYTGTALSNNYTAPFKSFADYIDKPSGHNQGWMHTSKFFTLTVGSDQDIAAGKTYDIQLIMTGQGALGNSQKFAIDNPAFALWTSGVSVLNGGPATGVQHGWNPTRGPNEPGININGESDNLNINENFRLAGVLDGHVGWIGYVNAGSVYTLTNDADPLNFSPQTASGKIVLDNVSHGGLNTFNKAWLTNPDASGTAYTNNYYLQDGRMVGSSPDAASMTLYGLKSGHYLIATGGSCPTSLQPTTVCGQGQQFTFSIQPAPPASPVTTTNNCMFNWAEEKYPTLFYPKTQNTQQIGGYDYRYYSGTNTYLGVLQGSNVHILQPNVSGDIVNVGTVTQIKPVTGCQ